MHFMSDAGATIVAVLAALVGLAIVAVIVSKNAQTPQVIQAGGSALASVIGAAVAPVSNNNFGTAGNVGGVTP
jgi:hypothetical protein